MVIHLFLLPIQNGDISHISSLGSSKIYYLSKLAQLEPIYVGGDLQPIFTKSIRKTIHRLIFTPFKFFFEFNYKCHFLPRFGIENFFCSKNMLAVLKKIKF